MAAGGVNRPKSVMWQACRAANLPCGNPVGGDGVSSDPAETILLTIFLKHDQSKNLEGIQGHLSATGWWERFPPKGVEIVSWNVVMGIGQIVTLRLPPHLINVVNVEIERCAWGAFSTEFFPTYDFIPVRERLAREWREAKQSGSSKAKARAADRRNM
jgi:hypothetical protein